MQDQKPPGIVDPPSTSFGNTLAGKFVCGNKLGVCAFRPITATTRDEPAEDSGKKPVNVHFLQPEFIFDDPTI